MKHWIIIPLLLISLVPMKGSASSFRPELMRIAIYKGADALRLDGKGVLLADEKGDPLRISCPVTIRRLREGISVNGRVVKSLIASAPVSLVLNGKGYRGTIEIFPLEKGLMAVNELPLEEYLVGLINCEISSQWPIEAIKAQAVIARTYALYQKEARSGGLYHLESTVMDQVYEGCDIEDSRAARGVRETEGEVVGYNGNLIQSFYHSNCGGHTESSENVWGFAYSYLQGVECRYCVSAPNGKWQQVIPLSKLENLLKNAGFTYTGIREIRGGGRNSSGRLSEVIVASRVGRVTIPAAQFRKAVGYAVIKSTNFEPRTEGENVLFSGVGYGHGVGLCQWGAKERAGEGFDYREILSYYYPRTSIMKWNKEA